MTDPKQLIDAYIDDALDDAGFAALCDWLQEDASNRRAFVLAQAMHSGIADWVNDRTGGLLMTELSTLANSASQEEELSWIEALAVLDDAGGEAQPVDFTAELARRERLAKANSWRARRQQARPRHVSAQTSHPFVLSKSALFLAIAGMLGLVVWLGWPDVKPTDNPSGRITQQEDGVMPETYVAATHVALIRSSLDDRWVGLAYDQQRRLAQGKTVTLRAGLAEVIFDDGAAVIIQGPATFEPTGPNAMRLDTGRLAATIPDTAHGFTVQTPGGLITDYGTEFGVHVDTDGQTLAQTFTGRIGLTPVGGGAEVQMLAGDAQIASPSGRMREVEPDALVFVREEEYGARRSTTATGYAGWLAYSYDLRRDPAVLGLFLAGSTTPGQQSAALPNLAGSRGSVSVSDARFVHRANRVEAGLRLESDNDAFTFEVGGPLDVVTLLVWAHIDPGDSRDLRTLIASDENNTPGALHWNLHTAQETVLSSVGLRNTQAHRDDSWPTNNAPLVGGQLPEGWHLYAITVDGQAGRVRHYLDGVMLAESQVRHRGPLVLGTTRVGAWLMDPMVGDHTRVLRGTVGMVAVVEGARDTTQMQAWYRQLQQAQLQGGTPPAPPDF